MHRITFIILFLFINLFQSCSKCYECEEIIESSMRNAELKCNGYANSYPEYDIIATYKTLGEFCDDIPKTTVVEKYEYCNGIIGKVRHRFQCTPK